MKKNALFFCLVIWSVVAFARDPMEDRSIAFLNAMGLELGETNFVSSCWTPPSTLIDLNSCSGRFTDTKGRSPWTITLTNELGVSVADIDVVEYETCKDSLIGIAFSIGGSSSVPVSIIAADTTVTTNQPGMMVFSRMTSHPQHNLLRRWFLFRNIALIFRIHSTIDAESAAEAILREGGVDIPEAQTHPEPESD